MFEEISSRSQHKATIKICIGFANIQKVINRGTVKMIDSHLATGSGSKMANRSMVLM